MGVLPMKAKKASTGAKPLTKTAILKQLSEQSGLKMKQVKSIMADIATIGAEEVKRVSKFTVPNLCMIKTRVKPATKAGIKTIFGKEVHVKARAAKTVVKAYPVAAIKKQF